MRQATSFSRRMLSVVTAILLFSIIIVACKKDSTKDVTKLSISNIHKDPLFQEYVVRVQNQFNSVRNHTLLSSIIKDGKISNEEGDIIHSIYGYTSKEEFRSSYTQISSILKQLWNKYDFNAYSNEEKKFAVLGTFEQIGHEKLFHTTDQISIKTSSTENIQNYMEDDCEKIRVNCILSVAAEATVMHLGCGALDLTFFLGIACHGAAIVYQKTAGDNCNLEARRCRNS